MLKLLFSRRQSILAIGLFLSLFRALLCESFLLSFLSCGQWYTALPFLRSTSPRPSVTLRSLLCKHLRKRWTVILRHPNIAKRNIEHLDRVIRLQYLSDGLTAFKPNWIPMHEEHCQFAIRGDPSAEVYGTLRLNVVIADVQEAEFFIVTELLP